MTSAESEIALKNANKQLVAECYERYFRDGDVDAVAQLIHEDFVQHSPDAPSGRDAYVDHLKHAAFLGGSSAVKRIIADGDYVAVHHNMTLPGDTGAGLAVVDLWRVADGKLVEHWDVEQPVPEPSRVPNGMF